MWIFAGVEFSQGLVLSRDTERVGNISHLRKLPHHPGGSIHSLETVPDC